MYNKKLLKQITILFSFFALTVLFPTCRDNLQAPDQDGKARVSIVIADNQSRTVFPNADIAKYKLLGGNNGAAESELAEFTAGETSVFLAPGNWNFTLNAYDANSVIVLQGKVLNKTISASGTNTINFNLSPLNSDAGTVQITIQFPVSAGITKITAASSIETKDFSIAAGSGEFVYTKTDVAAGDYFVSFKLYSGATLRSVVSEMILVRGGLTSGKTIVLAGADLKAGKQEIGISVPVFGATPATEITETAQYTGTVLWSPSVTGTFAGAVEYKAIITLTAKPGYTLQGLPANFFTVEGATAVSNDADSGIVTVVFPATVFALGDIGPGGGKIFYYSAAGFTMTDTGETCHYLEAAPNDMSSRLAWAKKMLSDAGSIFPNINTGTTIGTGRKNTANATTVDSNAAAKACKDYRGPNNFTDWFLPSKDELGVLYNNRSYVGNMGTDMYFWSSSQYNQTTAWYLNFSSGGSNFMEKDNINYVRAIRAF